MSKKNNLFKSASIMMVLMLLGKFLGVYRDRLNGSSFGTDSVEALAFNYASYIPNNFLDITFAAAVSGSFIPIFSQTLEKKGQNEAYKLAYNFISIIFLVSTVFTAVCMVFSTQIIGFMTGGNINSDVLNLGSSLLKLMFPIMVLSSIAFSLVGILQSMDEFRIPALMSIFLNLITIIYYMFFLNKFGVYGLCLAYLLGWLSQIAIQVPFLIKNEFKFKFKVNLKDPNIKAIVILMLPVMVSTWITSINSLVNMRAVAFIGSQGPVNLRYAYNLYMIISGVIVSSISNVIFPTLSKQDVNNDTEGFGKTMGQTIRVIFFLLIPVTFGLIALSQDIVRFLYETGKFNEDSTKFTATALRYFAVGIIGYGLQMVLSRGFYATKDGKTPAIASAIAIIANILLGFTLVRFIGIKGPALASSISISLACLILFVKMYKTNKNIFSAKIFFDIVKMFLIGVIMFFIVIFSRKLFIEINGFVGKTLILAIPTLLGSFVYLLLSIIIKLDETTFCYQN